MHTCSDHERTAPVETFAQAAEVVARSEVLRDGAPDLMAEVIVTVGAYREHHCCAAGAYARWLCSAAWRQRAAVH